MVSHSHDPLHLAISVESSLVSLSLTIECEINEDSHLMREAITIVACSYYGCESIGNGKQTVLKFLAILNISDSQQK
jgi:hypothetical protein